MKFTVSAASLLDAVKRAMPAVASTNLRPVLQCVKITASDGLLTIEATDTEVSILTHCSGVVQVGQPGRVCVNAALLASVLAEAGKCDVTISEEVESVTITADIGSFDLPTMNADEFPAMPSVADIAAEPLTVQASPLADAIDRTSFAVDKKESTRFALSGLAIAVVARGVEVAGTDSKRLAVHGLEVSGQCQHGLSLLPLRAVSLVRRCLADGAEVSVYLGKNSAGFRIGTTVIHTRLIEGRYPPYREIFPKKIPVSISLDVAEFASRVRAAALMTDAETKRIDLVFAGGKLAISAHGAAKGASRVSMPVAYDGKEIKIAFDPSYLLEFLRACGDETVTLGVTDGEKPAVFTVSQDYRYLVMPLAG